MISEKDSEYKPDEIPTEITRKLYAHYGIGGYSAGRITIYDCDVSTVDSNYIVLCEVEQTIKIPPVSQNDLKNKALDVLEDEKQKVLAENHERLKKVQDKIDNLLAIEYRPESESA